MSFDATEMSIIPLRGWRQARQSHAIRFWIGAVVMVESAIEFRDREGIYKDNSHNGQRLHEF